MFKIETIDKSTGRRVSDKVNSCWVIFVVYESFTFFFFRQTKQVRLLVKVVQATALFVWYAVMIDV